MLEVNLAELSEAIAAEIPQRTMLVWPGGRRSYGEVRERSGRLAGFLRAHGLGCHTEREALARWECGQDTVACYLTNGPEYVEALLGGWKARAAPFNVNYRYERDELADLLRDAGTRAVVYHARYAERLAAALPGVPSVTLLVQVADESVAPLLPGAIAYEDALASSAPERPDPSCSPDDLYVAYTGGTTGAPRGVLWRHADAYTGAMDAQLGATSLDDVLAVARQGTGVWFAVPPLMHTSAQWTVFSGLHTGGTVVLHDDARSFDADEVAATAARERATMMTIVGDAHAGPLVEALRRGDHDLSALAIVGTGGAPTHPRHKAALLELVPQVTIMDGYGASETGGMAVAPSSATEPSLSSAPAFGGFAGACVLSADRCRVLEPGDPEVGWVARRGAVPLGYLGDRTRTETAFPEIDGERYAVPGDRARRRADGTIELLGREGTMINTGGEKVFAEEVEDVLKRHPDVVDALVCGRPHPRWGSEVVALVRLVGDATATPADVVAGCAGSLARYKLPRAVQVVDEVPRTPTGKADYARARELAADASPVERR